MVVCQLWWCVVLGWTVRIGIRIHSFLSHLRIDFSKKIDAIENSPEHVILSTARDLFNNGKHISMKLNRKFPYKIFDNNMALVTYKVLTKRNFPYLEEVNHAIMQFWENGFIKNSLWINDLKGFALIQLTSHSLFHLFSVTTEQIKREPPKLNKLSILHVGPILIGFMSLIILSLAYFIFEICFKKVNFNSLSIKG